MEKPRNYLEQISEKLLLPRQIIAHLPQIEINGFSEISIDLQKGLLEYSQEKIKVAVSIGTVTVEGRDLYIRFMRDGRITVVGNIDAVTFACEEKQ